MDESSRSTVGRLVSQTHRRRSSSSAGGSVESFARWKNSSNASLRVARSLMDSAGALGPRMRSTEDGDMPGGAAGGCGGAAVDSVALLVGGVATPRMACSAGDGAGAATGAWPTVLGWYIRYRS